MQGVPPKERSVVTFVSFADFLPRNAQPSHALDFERLWIGFNRMDKRILQSLCTGQNPLQNRQVAPSTTFSALKRLMKAGYVIRTNEYSVEDPFFRSWIAEQMA